MINDYKNLTLEQLEEHVESVNWMYVPSHLITSEICEKYSCFSKLRIRIWIENILSRLIVKIDEKKYPNHIFFFIDDVYYMNFNKESGDLWCSYEHIWLILTLTFKLTYEENQFYIKNLVEQYFKSFIVTPLTNSAEDNSKIEKHFKKIQNKIVS